MTRRILVAGGSQGIGLAMARGLAAAGDAVTVLSRRPPSDEPGVPVLDHLACDLRDPGAVERTLLAAHAGRRAFDAVVFSAVAYGSAGRHPFCETTTGEWDAAMEVNARGLMLVCRGVLPHMLERGTGVIVGISSDIAMAPGPGRIAYAASKSAAHAILLGLAEELTGTGVSVAELTPTVQVDTPGIRTRRPADFVPDGYASATCFVSPILWLLGRAPEQHGATLLVNPDGRVLDHEGRYLT